MRQLLFLLFCIPLLVFSGCAAREQNSRMDYEISYAMAIVISAEVAEHFEDDPAAYDGVEFPLFCGYALVFPKENKLIFVPRTNLPISWVKARLEPIERNGYLTTYLDHSIREVRIDDKDFFMWLCDRLSSMYIIAYPFRIGDVDTPKGTPQFTRMCPYDSKKSPPVECGYHRLDVFDLRVK